MSTRKVSAGAQQPPEPTISQATEAPKPVRRNQLSESRWAKSSQATVQKEQRVVPLHRYNIAHGQHIQNINAALERRRAQETSAAAIQPSSTLPILNQPRDGKPALEEQVYPALMEAPKLMQRAKMDTTMMQETIGRATGQTAPGSSVDPSEHAPSPGFVEDDMSGVIIKDVRGEFPHEIYDNQEWDVVPGKVGPPKRLWDSVSLGMTNGSEIDREPFIASTTFTHRWVVSWMAHVPAMKATFLDNRAVDVKEHHDVNPMTGKLLPVVQHPITESDYGNNPRDYGLAQKWKNQTSESSTNRVVSKIRRTAMKEQEECQRSAEQEREQERAEHSTKRKNPYLCRVDAHLRPAHESDMDQVAEIYNQEVREGWRALDEREVPVATWRLILQNCRTEKLPFVVALSNYRNPHISVEEGNHKVIGFAFLDVASRGINGFLATTAKCSARLYVVVDPEYRRKRVGTALLDSIFQRTSLPYVEKELSYQFINPSQDRLYLERYTAARDYRVILMEVYVLSMGTVAKTAQGEEFNFLDKFLRAEFHLFLACHTGNFAVSRDGKTLDRLIFEHRAGGTE